MKILVAWVEVSSCREMNKHRWDRGSDHGGSHTSEVAETSLVGAENVSSTTQYGVDKSRSASASLRQPTACLVVLRCESRESGSNLQRLSRLQTRLAQNWETVFLCSHAQLRRGIHITATSDSYPVIHAWQQSHRPTASSLFDLVAWPSSSRQSAASQSSCDM